MTKVFYNTSLLKELTTRDSCQFLDIPTKITRIYDCKKTKKTKKVVKY